MLKFKRSRNSEKGYTLIELLVVAAIIGILLAIAIPNLIKARISANEANARKAMQTLRDAEAEYFEQDMDNNGQRDYTPFVGPSSGDPSLRDPDGDGTVVEEDALVDSSFEKAVMSDGTGVTPGSGSSDCNDSKAGYCLAFDQAMTPSIPTDFGWLASPQSVNKVGRKDFSVYGDGAIRCTASTQATGANGTFEASRSSPGCD